MVQASPPPLRPASLSDGDSAPPEADAEREPRPELADWWVWGVRKVAALFSEWLMISRGVVALFILYKVAVWYFTRESSELVYVGAGVLALAGVWGLGRLLGQFAWDRSGPDPERWLARKRDS